MVEAVSGLLEAGRCKLYCVDSFDSAVVVEHVDPARGPGPGAGRYEAWIVDRVVPWIHEDCGGAADIATVGVSLGAYHAVNFALKRADLFPIAIGLSGNYDPASWDGWGERGTATYFNNPMDYLAHTGRRASRVAARAGEPPARVRAGDVGGHERVARQRQAARRAADGEGTAARARPVGPRRAARLAVLARPVRAPPTAVLLRRPGSAAAGGALGRGLRAITR